MLYYLEIYEILLFIDISLYLTLTKLTARAKYDGVWQLVTRL